MIENWSTILRPEIKMQEIKKNLVNTVFYNLKNLMREKIPCGKQLVWQVLHLDIRLKQYKE